MHDSQNTLKSVNDSLKESIAKNCPLYTFLNENPDANVSVIEDYIIAQHDEYGMIQLAKRVNGVDLRKIEQAIIDSEDSGSIYDLAMEVDGVNIQLLRQKLIDLEWVNGEPVDASYDYVCMMDRDKRVKQRIKEWKKQNN